MFTESLYLRVVTIYLLFNYTYSAVKSKIISENILRLIKYLLVYVYNNYNT